MAIKDLRGTKMRDYKDWKKPEDALGSFSSMLKDLVGDSFPEEEEEEEEDEDADGKPLKRRCQ